MKKMEGVNVKNEKNKDENETKRAKKWNENKMKGAKTEQKRK